MSTLTVANVETANASTDLTLMTGNSSGPKLVITAGGNILLNNINANTINLSGVINPYTTNNLTVTKQLNLTSNVTPANLGTNNTVDWDPGVAGDYQIRFQANSTNATILEYNVYGLTGGVSGQIITLTNIGPTRVVLRTEEAGNSTFNQANSVNRFSLPNHISLEGYQSIELYYDGTSQRWRGVDTQGFPFAYKQGLTKGFFVGGGNPGLLATSDKITYATEITGLASSANSSVVRNSLAGRGNGDKAFFSGGQDSNTNALTITDRTTYSTETTVSVTGANLTQAMRLTSAAGNVDKGFIIGGSGPSPTYPVLSTANRTTYSTETTAAVASANLPTTTQFMAAASNSDKAFFSGGTPGTITTVANKTLHSTETTAVVSGANLSQARERPGAVGNQDKGFFAGGQTPITLVTADRTTYASETTAAVSGANLSQARAGTSGAGNNDKGFFGGGETPTSVTTSDRTTYSTESTAAVSGANLSQARAYTGAA